MSDQSWSNSGEVLPYWFLPGRTIKVEALFLYWSTCLQTTQHRTNQNQPKDICKRADFRQILQSTCDSGIVFILPSFFQEISLPGRLTTAMTAQGLWVLLGSESWKYLWKLFVQWSKSLPDAASNYEFIPKWWDAIRAAFRFLSSIIVEKGLVQT